MIECVQLRHGERTCIQSIVGTDEQGREGKTDKDDAAHERHGFRRDALSNEPATDDGQASAQTVPDGTTDDDTEEVLTGCQDDCRDLRSITPFLNEGKRWRPSLANNDLPTARKVMMNA